MLSELLLRPGLDPSTVGEEEGLDPTIHVRRWELPALDDHRPTQDSAVAAQITPHQVAEGRTQDRSDKTNNGNEMWRFRNLYYPQDLPQLVPGTELIETSFPEALRQESPESAVLEREKK